MKERGELPGGPLTDLMPPGVSSTPQGGPGSLRAPPPLELRYFLFVMEARTGEKRAVGGGQRLRKGVLLIPSGVLP